MVGPALYDFAVACLGQNEGVRWSTSEDVLRRQTRPIFDQCSYRELTVDQSVTATRYILGIRSRQNQKVFMDLYRSLQEEVQDSMPGVAQYPTMLVFQELELGINNDLQWATDPDILYSELKDIFQQCSEGSLKEKQALDLFCSLITEKQEMVLEKFRSMVQSLSCEIRAREVHSSRVVNGG